MCQTLDWNGIEGALNRSNMFRYVACFIDRYETLRSGLLAGHQRRDGTNPCFDREPSSPAGHIYEDPETKWERGFHDVFGPHAVPRDLTFRVQGNLIIAGLQTYQAPVAQRNNTPDIDLLAYASDGAPVIIELKAENSQEYLPKVIIQAARYAVLTRENLTNAGDRGYLDKWCEAGVQRSGSQPSATVRDVVCAAPEAWWNRQNRLPGPVYELLDHFSHREQLRFWFAVLRGDPDARTWLEMVPIEPRSALIESDVACT